MNSYATYVYSAFYLLRTNCDWLKKKLSGLSLSKQICFIDHVINS